MNDIKGPRILVVDDEVPIRKFLRIALSQEGFEVIEASTAKEGIAHVATYNPAVVLLDLGLPDDDGANVITTIRQWSAVPIIVLSARGNEEDKVNALDIGAHDYLTKPFGMRELLARVRAALRNSPANGGQQLATYESGSLKIDLALRQVFHGNVDVHLTPLEYNLISYLAQHAGKVITHRQLLKEVWGAAYQGQSQYLRVFINQIRKKIEDDPSRPKFILTEPGVGYRLRAQ